MYRLRTIIYSEIILSLGNTENETVKFNIRPIESQNSSDSKLNIDKYRHCDVISKIDIPDIDEAFVLLYNELNNFLDRFSMISYGIVKNYKIISISPETVKPGEEFVLALPQYTTSRKTLAISLDELNLNIKIKPEQERWLRLLRNGLNSFSEEEKYINYYSLLEEIARVECTEYIITKCNNPNCLKEVNTGRKATNNFIMKILQEHEIDFKLIKLAPELRNKIAHGGANKNKIYQNNVRIVGSHLEEICLLELEKRLPLKIKNRFNAHITDVPFFKHQCKCTLDKKFQLIRSSHTIPSRFVQLKHEDPSVFEGQNVEIGVPLDSNERPIIDPFVWPDIIE